MMLSSYAGVLPNERVVTTLIHRMCWNSRRLAHVLLGLKGLGSSAWIASRIKWAAHQP